MRQNNRVHIAVQIQLFIQQVNKKKTVEVALAKPKVRDLNLRDEFPDFEGWVVGMAAESLGQDEGGITHSI